MPSMDLKLSTTAILLQGAKAGDDACRNALAEHALPKLRRMAGCYLPKSLRPRVDPEDIVQEALLRALTRIETFVPRCEGAFIVYLRRILLNVIADLGRNEKRSLGPTSIQEAVGQETWERYRTAVAQLSEVQEEAVVLYVECGMDFEAIRRALDSPSANAARRVISRGLQRLAELMHVQQNA